VQNELLIKALEKYSLKTKRGKGCGYPSTKAPINEIIRAILCHETPYL